MDIPANRARMEFALEGTPYPVIAVNGEERLNQGFYFEIDIQVTLDRQVHEFVGHPGQLKLTGLDGEQRLIAGLVESAEDVGFDADKKAKRIVLGFMPRVRILEQVRGPALWLGLDFQGLVKTLLDESGLHHTGEVGFEFSQPHAARPWTLRAPEETSAELIQRRMAHEGIFFRVDEHEGRERLIFADHNAHCPYVNGGVVRKLAEAGMVDSDRGRPQTGVFRVSQHSVAQPGAARGYVFPENNRVRPLASDPRASQRPGLDSRFATGCSDLPGAEAWTALRDRYHDQQAEHFTLRANRVDLAAGHCITLEAGPAPGDYLIMAVKHTSAQAAGLNVAGPTVPYTCEATLVPRVRPYVSAFPPKRKLPPLIGARIESSAAYAQLDEFGRYRLRQLFEPGVNPHAGASIPIRKQSPHGGPPSPNGKPVGWHAPLQDGDEVLLSCLNHDPEQLMIAGGLYNPGKQSPVLGENLTQNIYRSAGANALIMDDKKAKELIQLHARDGLLCLELNADKAGQWVGLTTVEGAAELTAKKTQLLKSGDTLTERAGNDRIQQVENRHLTKTKQGEIHQQSARDAAIRAGEYVEIISGQDTRFIAGKHIRIRVKNNARYTVEQGDAWVHVNNGHVQFQGTKSMRIRGQGGGPITFEQGGAGFRIREDGTIDLFGKTVSLGGPNGVNFAGNVNYEVPGGAPAPQFKTRPALEPEPVQELIDPNEPVEKPIDETVALVPVRYAIDKRHEDDGLYAYQSPQLAKDLPDISQARYILRRTRAGWLYLFLMGRLYAFTVAENGTLNPEADSEPALEAAKIKTFGQALLLPKAAQFVWLAYSEHPWSDNQRQRVEANQGGCRNRQMQRFGLGEPGKDAFDLTQIDEEVADYGGPGDGFDWSDEDRLIDYDPAGLQARLIDDAEGGQQVVALHDPIGISHDLAALIEEDLGELAGYLAEPQADADQPLRERYRKKLVAETIERLYQSRYNADNDVTTLAKLRQEHWRAEPANRGKPEPELNAFESQVRADIAESSRTERYAKHVDEAARQAFLNDFNAEVDRLQQQLDKRRLDRIAWLNTWKETDAPHQLGAAWESFDLDDEADWRHFELSFARSSASLMGMAPNRQEGLPDRLMDKEMALYDQWLAAPPKTSPLYRALFGHTPLRQAVDEYMAAREQDAQAEQTASKDSPEAPVPAEAQSEADGRTTIGLGGAALIGRAVNTAADRSGSLSEASANLLEQLYQRFPYTVGTQSLVTTYTAYVLNKPTTWRGAVADNIHNLLARLFNRRHLNDLMHALEIRYGQYVTKVTHTTEQFQKLFFEAAGKMPQPAATKTTATRQGHLRRDGVMAFEISEEVTQKKAVIGKGVANPFRGYGTAGISALAGVLYLVNLKRAVVEFDIDKQYESTASLMSAIAAVGGGINSGLIAFKGVAPTSYSQITGANRLVNWLTSKFAFRLFGYGGAFLSGATLGIQSGKLINQGDTDAGLWYAGSAVAVTAGGAALTYVGGALLAGATPLLLTPVGWFVLGIALLGGSFALQWSGDAAKDDDIEKWLDACTFGKRERSDAPEYGELDQEMSALGYAMHAPKQIEMDWSQKIGFDHYLAEAVVFLPGYRFGQSELTITGNGQGIAPIEQEHLGCGTLVSLRYYLRKDEGTESVTFKISYRPSDAFVKDYTLSITVPEPKNSTTDEPTIPGP